MKAIREVKRLNTREVATRMKVTLSTYQRLEEETNPRYGSVEKFCEVAGISLSFLLAEDVPVTEANIAFFHATNKSLFLTHEQLRQKEEVFEELMAANQNSGKKQFLI